MTGPEAHDAIVLAGGAARRLGGTSKPDVVVAGRRLLDRTLEAARDARRVVVVGPAQVAPPGVLSTLEDPPGGGPVAGLDAGIRALPDGLDLLLVLACDVPRAAGAVQSLFRAMSEGADGAVPADGAVLVDGHGRRQPLVGLYRRRALEAALVDLAAAGGVQNAPVRRLLERLTVVDVADEGGFALDVDTWEEHARAEAQLAQPAEGAQAAQPARESPGGAAGP